MKKLFYRFCLFFKGLYISWLKRHTIKVLAKANKAEQKWLKTMRNDPMYVHYLYGYTTDLISKTNSAARELLPLLGKNPDYVPPPPSPPPVFKPVNVDETKAHWVVDTKERPSRMNVVGSYDPWVKKPADHPILRSRTQYEEKLRAAEAEKEAKQAAIDPPMVTELTEIGGDALDSLREAVTKVEQACDMEGCGCSDKKSE